MPRFPEATATIRNVVAVQRPGPAQVARVTVRRDRGGPVSFYETCGAGQVVTCDDLAGAYSAAERLNQ